MGTRVLELDTIQYPSASTENIQVGNNSVTFPSGISVDINGGAIDGTPIGAGTASTGAFTTLSTTGTATLPTVNIDGGNIDGATIATSDITVGSSKTLDVSGGTLTTSTAQKQAVVDGATIEAQDLATGSGTTLPNAVQDNITRLGSVTQGTIGSGVTQDGIPRVIKMVTMDAVGQGVTNGMNRTIMHNSISFSAVSGRVYYIDAMYEARIEISSGAGNNSANGQVSMHVETTSRSNGDYQNSAYGGELGTTSFEFYYVPGNYSISTNYAAYWTGPINLKGFFTAGSTATHYYHPSAMILFQTGDVIRFDYSSSVIGTTKPTRVIIYEITGVSVTAHNPI